MRRRITRLSALDRMFLHQETRAWPAHVGGLALLEGGALVDESRQLRLDHVRGRIRCRLTQVPQLRRRLLVPPLLGGAALWVDDARFDIGNHVFGRAVTPPGSETDFLQAAAEIYAEPLDRRRPLWELWFLTGLGDGRVGVLLKLHHSIADGLAVLAIIASLVDFQPDARDPAEERWQPAPMPGTWSLVADNLTCKVQGIGRAAASLVHPKQLMSTARLNLRMTRDAFARTAAPNTSLNAVVGTGRRVRFLSLDLAAVKDLAHTHEGKVNDVVLELWTAGLRHLLQSRNESVTGIDLIATMTVSLRSPQGAQTEGNQLGFVQLPLPVWESDASKRLDLIIGSTRQAKGQQQAAAMASVLATLSTVPIVSYLSSHQRTVNVKVSNVVGSPAPVYLLGCRITDMLPIMRLLGNVGLALCALSYNGQIFLAVTADAAGFPDIETLMEGMRLDWNCLVGEHINIPSAAVA